jgi:nitrogen regulatory protein P-II 1
VEEVVNIIIKSAKTGETGDGKIFVYRMQGVVRIRTGEKKEEAIK